jgi:hypothetical protein
MTHRPIISDDPMYLLLRDRLVEEFNRRKAAGERPVLVHCELTGMDLRDIDADGLDLTDACLNDADLRGVDLRGAILRGATLHGARIAGAYFGDELRAEEIDLSLQHGTRLRYRR